MPAEYVMEFSQSVQHLIRENEPLAPLTWLQVGGASRFYAEPCSLEELRCLVADAQRLGIPFRLLGDGSNILVRDAGCDGLVINLSSAELSSITVTENKLICGSGARLSHAISHAVGAGLAGIEYLAGIPGTIGGAVVGNAGVKNCDFGSRVTRVRIIDSEGLTSDLERSSLQFGFRHGNLDGTVVVEVEIGLEPTAREELTRRMQAAWIVQRAAQPPSGTRGVQAFVDPDGASIAEVLEEAALKGYTEGPVALSSEFPGFLVVNGVASSDQVLALIGKVTQSVHARTGIQLQPQLRIW
ncbi:MAG: FAD-binding protein [Planctomycetales bacterium]|nr:FAD-binding protein [Planctomycetales bacterium]